LTCVFNEGNWERTQAMSKAGVARTFKPGVVITLFSGENRIAMFRGIVSHTGGGSCSAKLALVIRLERCNLRLPPDVKTQWRRGLGTCLKCIQPRLFSIESSNAGSDFECCDGTQFDSER
jgi:hypothetical protein